MIRPREKNREREKREREKGRRERETRVLEYYWWCNWNKLQESILIHMSKVGSILNEKNMKKVNNLTKKFSLESEWWEREKRVKAKEKERESEQYFLPGKKVSKKMRIIESSKSGMIYFDSSLIPPFFFFHSPLFLFFLFTLFLSSISSILHFCSLSKLEQFWHQTWTELDKGRKEKRVKRVSISWRARYWFPLLSLFLSFFSFFFLFPITLFCYWSNYWPLLDGSHSSSRGKKHF